METILQALLGNGVLGIMCALLVVWIWTKDKQQTAERKELLLQLANETAQRVKDAQKFTGLALDLQAKVLAAIEVVKDQVETFQGQNAILERIASKLPSKKGGSDGAA
jgi:hypothetical protein